MHERVEEGTEEEEVTWKIFAKYFAHGFAFSLLFLGFGVYFWLRVVFGLIFLFFPLGIIVVVILLFFVDGLNILLTSVIWGIKMDTAFLCLLFHGITLLLFLSIMNGVFILLPNFLFPGIPTAAITFIVGAFVDGYVGKSVAEWFPRER